MNVPWRIELFGGLRARQGDRLIARFAHQKSASLLAYLAYYQQRSHPRDELAELLWPETAPEVGRHNLRQALHSVRRQLEPAGAAEPPPPVFLATRADVQLSPAVATDVAEFEAALKSAARAADPTQRAEALARAVELYRGHLLPGHYDDWLTGERERLAEACFGALRQLTDLCREAGDRDRAIEYARRAVALDSLREEAHCALMRLLIAAGRPADAQRQFQELERVLREQLDEKPSAEAVALAQSLSGSGSPPAMPERAAVGSPSPRFWEKGEGPIASTPPPSAPAAPRLPAPVTRFFGRDEELQRLGRLLCDPTTRLVTLTGPGGSGKTRLAIEAARRSADAFGGAIWFVPLADRADARALPDAIAEALPLPAPTPAPPLERAAAFLSRYTPEAPALLILDNFEQLIEEGARVVAELIGRVPGLTCLVTSRQRLEISGEHEFAVLPLPTPDAPHPTPHTLFSCPSVQLFTDRAQASRPDFAVTPRNAAAVAKLCERLEGIPLALELAAARAQMLTPSQMLVQLETRFDFLVSRRRDIAPRHRTLRAAIGWSYELLPPELRRFFARLSVFHGRWTLEAAEAVCGDFECKVLEALTELQERSLILVAHGEEETAYQMLESLREYAAEQLSSEERALLRRRHAEYYRALAETAAAHFHGPDQATWMDRLEADHDNFRAALAWSLEQETPSPAPRLEDERVNGMANGAVREPSKAPGALEMGLGLAGTLHFFWYVRGHFSEGRRWLEQLLALPAGREPTAERATALYAAAGLARAQGHLRPACLLYEESLTDWQAVGDREGIANTLCQWGYVADRMGDHALASRLLEESLAICRELDDPGKLAHVLKCIGANTLARGDAERARALFAESLALYSELRDMRGVAMILGEMAHLALSQADDERADMWLREQVELSSQLKDRVHMALALRNLGIVARHRGDHRGARSFFQASLNLQRELGEQGEMAELLAHLGVVAGAEGDRGASHAAFAECLALLREAGNQWVVASCLELMAESVAAWEQMGPSIEGTTLRVTRLLAAAAALRGAADAATLYPAARRAREQIIEAARVLLGEPTFNAAWREGGALTLEAALHEALLLDH